MENLNFCAVYNFKFDNKIQDRFFNKFNFFKGELNKSALLLIKGVYPYKYMDSWTKFDKDLLSNEEMFYSSLDIEDNRNLQNYEHALK